MTGIRVSESNSSKRRRSGLCFPTEWKVSGFLLKKAEAANTIV